MALTGYIQGLYKDRARTEALFPLTKTRAVSDDDGVLLDTLLSQKARLINMGNYAGDFNDLNIPLNSILCVNGAECTNCPSTHWGSLETWGSWDTLRIQRFTINSGSSCQRIYNQDAWTEWEWINPPQNNGVEYRTTERWNGHAIYLKNIPCGTLTEGRKLIELPELLGAVVLAATGYINQSGGNFTMIPGIYEKDPAASTSVTLIVNTTALTCNLQIWGGSGFVGKNAFVQLKYFRA